jgi:hypothetical protein
MRGPMRGGNKEEGRVVPDVLLATQLTRRDPVRPERALVASVLLDGIECFLRNHGAVCGPRRRLLDEAEQWLFRADDGSPFSFEQVCEFLSLDPAHLRSGLRRWSADLAHR